MEPSDNATGHLGGLFQIGDELLICSAELQDVVPALMFRSKRQRQLSLRKKYGPAPFNNKGIAYSRRIAPKFNFRSSLVRNQNKRDSFFSYMVEDRRGSFPGARERVD